MDPVFCFSSTYHMDCLCKTVDFVFFLNTCLHIRKSIKIFLGEKKTPENTSFDNICPANEKTASFMLTGIKLFCWFEFKLIIDDII